MAVQVFPAAGSGVKQYTVEFTSSGTFTLPAGYGVGNPLTCDVLVLGGGGGGGSGSSNNLTSTWSYGGGGGGSGIGVMLKNLPITANTTVTVGAGGTGGAASTGILQGYKGNLGGATSFGFYTAPGGGFGERGGGELSVTPIPDAVTYNGGTIRGGSSPQNSLAGNPLGGGIGGPGGSPGGNGGVNAATGRGGFGGISNQSYALYGTGTSANFIGSGGAQSIRSFGQLQLNALIVWDNSNLQFRFSPNALTTSDLLPYVPGGGGGGGAGYESYGNGGAAGTSFAGGDGGASQTNTGSRTGANATNPGCGGGGGGAGVGGTATFGGAGGNGASGLVRITYWA